MLKELIESLKKLHNPQAAWMAVESEILNNSKIGELGEVECLGGAILSITPESIKDLELPKIREAAIASWNLYKNSYKSDVDLFNENRVQLRQSIMGLLSSPKFA